MDTFQGVLCVHITWVNGLFNQLVTNNAYRYNNSPELIYTHSSCANYEPVLHVANERAARYNHIPKLKPIKHYRVPRPPPALLFSSASDFRIYIEMSLRVSWASRALLITLWTSVCRVRLYSSPKWPQLHLFFLTFTRFSNSLIYDLHYWLATTIGWRGHIKYPHSKQAMLLSSRGRLSCYQRHSLIIKCRQKAPRTH